MQLLTASFPHFGVFTNLVCVKRTPCRLDKEGWDSADYHYSELDPLFAGLWCITMKRLPTQDDNRMKHPEVYEKAQPLSWWWSVEKICAHPRLMELTLSMCVCPSSIEVLDFMTIHFVSRNSVYQLSQAALYLALSLLGKKTSRDIWLTQQSAHE